MSTEFLLTPILPTGGDLTMTEIQAAIDAGELVAYEPTTDETACVRVAAAPSTGHWVCFYTDNDEPITYAVTYEGNDIVTMNEWLEKRGFVLSWDDPAEHDEPFPQEEETPAPDPTKPYPRERAKDATLTVDDVKDGILSGDLSLAPLTETLPHRTCVCPAGAEDLNCWVWLMHDNATENATISTARMYGNPDTEERFAPWLEDYLCRFYIG